jgi:hypothetical protein
MLNIYVENQDNCPVASPNLGISVSRNQGIINTITIDFHGQHVKQAIGLLKRHLLTLACIPCKSVPTHCEFLNSICVVFMWHGSKHMVLLSLTLV